MKIALITIFLFMAVSINAQEDQTSLNNRTFIAKVGSMCEETSEPSPCAGREIYLVLAFKIEEVLILEKYISSCGEEEIFEIGNYKWTVLEGNEVKIDTNPEKVESIYLKNLTLELINGQLLGKRMNSDNSISEYTFINNLE